MAGCFQGASSSCAASGCNGCSCPCPPPPPCSCYNPYTPCPPPCPAPPPAFKASALTNATLPANTNQQVLFPQVILANPAYVASVSAFQAPATGTYSFTASVTWSTSAAATLFTLSLLKNQSATGLMATTTSNAIGNYVTGITGCLALVAGDTVTVNGLANFAITIVGNNPFPAPLTSFQGFRVC